MRQLKIKKSINMRKQKKITEKIKPWKNPIKPIKILKKSTGSVWFYKLETEKTKPNQAKTQKKT